MTTRPRVGRAAATVLVIALVVTGLAAVAGPAAVEPATAGSSGFVPSDAPVTVVEHGFPDGGAGPNQVVAGPDGRLWVTLGLSNQIAARAADGTTTVYDLPTANASPADITVGPDGALWFVEATGDKVGRITTAGDITEYPLTAGSGPNGITLGPDGNLWFTERDGNRIGRITPQGDVTEFDVPTADAEPWGITAGPDGNLWFTELNSHRIGRVTPAGQVTEPIQLAPGSSPFAILLGPDDALWFTEFGARKVGRFEPGGDVEEYDLPADHQPVDLASDGSRIWVTTQNVETVVVLSLAGAVEAVYPLSVNSSPTGILVARPGHAWITQAGNDRLAKLTPGPPPIEVLQLEENFAPNAITNGPDGNVWFVGTDVVGRVTVAGDVTTFPLPAGSEPSGIAAGTDGNLWFTESGTNKIGRITPAGDITEFDVPTPNAGPEGITTGPDGRLWFSQAEAGADAMSAVTTDGVFSEYAAPMGANPQGVTPGPGDTVWYAAFESRTAARYELDGSATVFPTGASADGITLGPGGLVWIAYTLDGKVGTLTDAGLARDLLYEAGIIADLVTGPDGKVWFTWFTGEQNESRIVRLVPPAPTMDARVAKVRDGPYKGKRVFNETGDKQTRVRTVDPGETTNFFFSVRDIGPGAGLYALFGNAAPPCFRFWYFMGGVDRTDDFLAGISAPEIAEGGRVKGRLRVKAKGCASRGAEAAIHVDAEPTRGVAFDRVRARVRV